jgi:hypothetical protein
VDFPVALAESVIALAVLALVYRFVSRLFRRPPEEPDDGEPFAQVGAPLRPTTPRRTAKAAAEKPDEPDGHD